MKLLTVVDEYTRECLAIEVGRSIGAEQVVAVLARLVRERGRPPQHLRSDNGPEFVAAAVRRWLGEGRDTTSTLFIGAGSPWENAYVESFNGKLRDELLDREAFGSLLEAQVVVEDWRRSYNHERPHSALGYQTPAAFAAACDPITGRHGHAPAGSATLRPQGRAEEADLVDHLA